MALAVAIATSACAAIEGLDKYGTGSGGGADSGGTDGPTGSDGTVVDGTLEGAIEEIDVDDASEDAPAETSVEGAPDVTDAEAFESSSSDVVSSNDAPPFDAGNCTTNQVDPVHGVFVAPGGSDAADGAGCGTTPSSPCASIGAGIATAAMKIDGTTRNIVYVSAGRYTEKLTLAGGITVQGGWHWGGDGGVTWSFDCSSVPESQVVVQAPPSSNTTVVATSNNGMTATLSTLTVLSKSAANPGESLYGIFATGANTLLALTDVVVTVQAGGAGQAGSTGAPGVAPPASCAAGDGNMNDAAGTVGAAGNAGTFSSTGFTTHTGGAGGTGTAGDNGTAGAPGASVSGSVCGPSPCTNQQMSCVGGAGTNGCGGGGGLGGSAGAGGGSAVAIFAYDATVTITAGGFQAGNGGSGGAGGAGGAGASGSSGSMGSQTLCAQSACADSGSMGCIPLGTTVTGAGGAAGGKGGQGSTGGQGGGGAGGDSYVIATGGLATGRLKLVGSPALTPGAAGAGGSSNGASGNVGTQNTF